MNFIEAAKIAQNGKKFRRSNWVKGRFIWTGEDREFSIIVLKFSGGFLPILSLEDYLANNWEICEEPREYFDFFEAMRRLEVGKKVSNLYQEAEYYQFNKFLMSSDNTNRATFFDIPEIASNKWYEVE